jgi:diacylglycerol kinase family enzyme
MSALEATGRLSRFKGFRQWEPLELEVQADRPVPVGVDGEAMVFDPPLLFRTRPAAMGVRVPTHSPGRSQPGPWA